MREQGYFSGYQIVDNRVVFRRRKIDTEAITSPGGGRISLASYTSVYDERSLDTLIRNLREYGDDTTLMEAALADLRGKKTDT